MPYNKLVTLLGQELAALRNSGRAKGAETVIRRIIPSGGDYSPRFLLEGEGEKPFLRMNSNNYLGLSFHAYVVPAGKEEIRFQICADHNAADIDFALDVIGRFETKSR